jgi:hypothetical protein
MASRWSIASFGRWIGSLSESQILVWKLVASVAGIALNALLAWVAIKIHIQIDSNQTKTAQIQRTISLTDHIRQDPRFDTLGLTALKIDRELVRAFDSAENTSMQEIQTRIARRVMDPIREHPDSLHVINDKLATINECINPGKLEGGGFSTPTCDAATAMLLLHRPIEAIYAAHLPLIVCERLAMSATEEFLATAGNARAAAMFETRATIDAAFAPHCADIWVTTASSQDSEQTDSGAEEKKRPDE